MAEGRFSCFLIGGQSLLIRCAEALLREGHLLCGVVSDDPQVVHWAARQGVRRVTAGENLRARLGETSFDYLFSVVNLSVLPDALLALPRAGAVNFHDGPLPEYAGLNVPAWALLNGEREHGVTWHLMTREVDAGDILEEERFAIADDETALSLNMKCFEAGAASFERLIDVLARGEGLPRHQVLARRTLYARHKRPEAACLLDWTQPAAVLSRLSRALEYGAYPNPLGLPKLWLGDEVVVVRRVEVQTATSVEIPGTVLALTEAGVRVATPTQDVLLCEMVTLGGRPLASGQLASDFGVRVGRTLPTLGAQRAQALSAQNEAWARHEQYWEGRLAGLETLELPYAARRGSRESFSEYTEVPFVAPSTSGSVPGDLLLAAHALYFARLSGKAKLDLPYQGAELRRDLEGTEGLFASHVPLRVTLQEEPFSAFCERLAGEMRCTERQRSYPRDLLLRHSELRASLDGWHGVPWAVALERTRQLSVAERTTQADLTVIVADDGTCCWRYHEGRLRRGAVQRMQGQLTALLKDVAAAPEKPATALTILADEDARKLAVWNATVLEYPREACIHTLFEVQAARTPEATALAFRDTELSYRELNARANRLAHRLGRHGVRPGDLVGVLMDRSAELVVALLGVLKAGAAYVPLDPSYPADRLRFMVEDAGVVAVLTETRYQALLPEMQALTFILDTPSALDTPGTLDTAGEALAGRAENPQSGASSADLAYVIYTSGSTGTPKGVMVEHRNVVNFFAGMDARLGPGELPGVWLAVTSISFDISVLELFWTLARGFKVVLYRDETRTAETRAALPNAHKPLDFSLFYFASDEGERTEDKYHLFLEGAKFADAHGFSAVWTPERHFHAFGGLYPSPAVTAAALSTITKNIRLRAGSCVLPLHHPVRVAEEWALVDNLSGGRVEVSFASGWQPDDFVLAPENYGSRHALLERDIGTVRALWRGETRTFPGPNGEVSVRILPRPLQPELPTWITAAGNPETFRQAGRLGVNLLTHLLGQTVNELAEKIALYREAWQRSGHPGEGQVALMLHTFVANDPASVRERVREPLKRYLRSATGLLKGVASSFPAFRRIAEGAERDLDAHFEALTDADMDALLEHAFGRYYATSGLFGTPEGCLEMVDRLKGIGVDEVACLIDFGVPSEIVLAHLPQLERLRVLANADASPDTAAYALPTLIERHGVTHLQCTPALAKMLTLEPDTRAALGALEVMLVGGEALPSDLAQALCALVPGEVHNMYGPTETTIWSTTHRLTGAEGRVPLGTPIANTRTYILDAGLQLLPAGVPGELVIAGEGVVRGYLNRSELTAERFLRDPFGVPGSRMYRTGDLARYREDGVLEFLGRLDHQVKLRGFRIELGEIETALARHSAVQQAVVVAREDTPGDKRLVAYLVPNGRSAPLPNELRNALLAELPEYMVPAVFVTLDAFPLTPNKKVDRRALPAPEGLRPDLEAAWVPPRTPAEQTLAEVWERVLGLERVGAHDNFFELGGDSLLALHAVSQAVKAGLPLTLRQLFLQPTLSELAQHTAPTPALEAEQELVTGPVPLVPSQHRFFYERRSPDPHHWNHALLLATARLDPGHLEITVREILRHHDALRLRFTATDAGWQQRNAGKTKGLPFLFTDLSKRPERERVAEMERLVVGLQESLDLTEGPLLRVAYFDLGALGGRLFVTMHHLVLDPISWRIFWEDFATVYRQVSCGERPAFPSKTSSFKAWAEALEAQARTEGSREGLREWLALPWDRVRPLPLDIDAERFKDNLNGSFGVVIASLSQAETGRFNSFLDRSRYRAEEVLVAALAQTFTTWTGCSVLHFDMVGLNRGALLENLDLSRTLGYFVAYLPALIDLAGAVTPNEVLEAVAAQLRRVLPLAARHELLRYLSGDRELMARLAALPRAEVLLNYRGAQEHDESFLDTDLWRPAAESRGPSHSPQGLRHHPFNIAGDVIQGCLTFTFTYSKKLHQPATVEMLATTFTEAVRRAILLDDKGPPTAADRNAALTAYEGG